MADPPRLNVLRKSVYATGDLTINTVLVSLGLVYTSFYLIEIAGLRPALAGLVPLVGRTVDALTDPAMGRLSDVTRLRVGRRRPYFLLGALPFGVSFALLWIAVPFDSQLARFVYYAGVYVALSVAMTVVSVPYLALLPEMALGYDARTSLNTYRNVGSTVGVFAAVGIRPAAEALGGGAEGFAAAGALFGVLLALPWFAVYAGTFERPGFQRPAALDFRSGLRVLVKHQAYRRLVGLYLCGRIAMDLISAMLILYFTHWLRRSEDFEIAIILFFATVLMALPIWLQLSRATDKAVIFMIGSLWFGVAQLVLLFVQPEWPRWTLFVFAPVAAFGFTVLDLMPWSMVGDVVDEDELATGERREGLYNGAFMFLRKLGGALGVALALGILDLSGFRESGEQSQTTLWTLRLLTSLGPMSFVLISVLFALGYPLGRARHAAIRAELDARGEVGARAG